MPNRGKYKCGRCGQLKQKHNCEYIVQADVCSTGTEVISWQQAAALGQPHPFLTERTLPIRRVT